MRALRKRLLPVAALVGLMLFSAVHAFALEVDRSVLANGLTVLHAERDNLPIVKVALLVKTGSFDEPAQKAGLANLTAALLKSGTTTRSATQIDSEIEFLGADLGAGADKDYSVVTLSVLKKDVRRGFEILSDVLLNPTFPDEEIERNRELIKGSLRRSEEDPSYLAQRAFMKAVYGDHPYGRLVRGLPETLDGIDREDITGFYSAYFRPNNSVLSVVGDLTRAELDALVGEFLSGWKKGPVPPRQPVPVTPPAASVIEVDRALEQANIVMGHIGVSRGNPDFYALQVMNYILGGGGFSSRLMGSIRDEMGLAYDVHSFFTSNKGPGLFEVGVQTKNESANEVIGEITRQMKLMTDEGVSDKELEDAKAYLVGSFPMKLDTMDSIARFLVSVEYFDLGLDYIDKYPAYIKSVTREDVLRVARHYLHPEACVVVVVAEQSRARVESR
jgi:zinc protease